MAQLFLGAVPGEQDEVVSILEDGVHPGRKVVQDPDVWNSRPLPKFRIVHVPGERAAVFSALEEPERNSGPPDFAPLSNVQRRNVLALTPGQFARLRADRTITLARAQIGSRRNPDAAP